MEIYIESNKITQVNLSNLEIMMENYRNKNYLTKIFLFENPITCDCNMYDLLRYMNEETEIPITKKMQIILLSFVLEIITCSTLSYRTQISQRF